MALPGMDDMAAAMTSDLLSTFPAAGVCLALRPENHRHRQLFQVSECRALEVKKFYAELTF